MASASQLVGQLSVIRDRVNNMGIDDERARELQELMGQSIGIIQKMNNPSDGFFENRRRNALNELEQDLGRYADRYWQSSAKTDKISEFSRARNTMNLVLSGILMSFRH